MDTIVSPIDRVHLPRQASATRGRRKMGEEVGEVVEVPVSTLVRHFLVTTWNRPPVVDLKASISGQTGEDVRSSGTMPK